MAAMADSRQRAQALKAVAVAVAAGAEVSFRLSAINPLWGSPLRLMWPAGRTGPAAQVRTPEQAA